MKTILVVDDEFDIADALTSVFEEEGYAVRSCSNGRECLELLRGGAPSLLMLDVMMPGMSGLDVLSVIRKDRALDAMPVILMSAVKPPVSEAELRFQTFLQKPFTLPVLLDRVRGLIGEGGGRGDA